MTSPGHPSLLSAVQELSSQITPQTKNRVPRKRLKSFSIFDLSTPGWSKGSNWSTGCDPGSDSGSAPLWLSPPVPAIWWYLTAPGPGVHPNPGLAGGPRPRLLPKLTTANGPLMRNTRCLHAAVPKLWLITKSCQCSSLPLASGIPAAQCSTPHKQRSPRLTHICLQQWRKSGGCFWREFALGVVRETGLPPPPANCEGFRAKTAVSRRPGGAAGRGSQGHPPLPGFVPSGPPSACRSTSGNRRRPPAPRPSPLRRRRPTAARRAPRCSPRCGSLAPRETWLCPAAPLLCCGPDREKGYRTRRDGAGREGKGREGKEGGRRPAAVEGPGGAERRNLPAGRAVPRGSGRAGRGPGAAGKRRPKFVSGVVRASRPGAGWWPAAARGIALRSVCAARPDRRAHLPICGVPKGEPLSSAGIQSCGDTTQLGKGSSTFPRV